MIITYEIDKALAIFEYLKQSDLPRKVYKYLKSHDGLFLVNGVNKEVNHTLTLGDTLILVFPKETLSEVFNPIHIPLNVAYEDEYLIVIDKPANLATIPTQSHHDINLANAVAYYFKSKGIDANIHFVNRLDKDTSGLVMLSKHGYVHHLMQQTLHTTLHRFYLAKVEGITPERGSIDAPIGKSSEGIKRELSPSGKHALTLYERLHITENRSVVEVTLKTGRTHQIRVHLASIGHPIVGDVLYGTLNNRLYLHAYKLAFVHPMTGLPIELTSKIDFLNDEPFQT